MTGRRGGRPRHQKRPGVPPRELALVGLILLNVGFLAFVLGGVRMSGELVGLVLALATLFLLPQWNFGELEGTTSPVIELLKLPLFWLGLGLYGLFFIHAWNVEWQWAVVNGRPVIVTSPPPVPWLPSGLIAPYDESNPLRSMVFYTIPWISCCSAWAGLSTRRSVNYLLNGLAILGAAFAAVALYQHYVHMDKVLGIFPTIPSKLEKDIPFWGTLINQNHAAFYLIMANGLCMGLFLSGLNRELKRFKRTGGAWMLHLGLAVMCTFAVLLAQSRGAIISVALQWLLFILICTLFLVHRYGVRGLVLPGVFIGLAAISGTSFLVNPAIFESQKEEWEDTFDLVENPELEARYYMMRIATDMIRERPWFGYGAGSWRYLHLPHLKDYPEFKTLVNRWPINPETGKRQRKQVTIWFENAHVDLLEYLVDWGVVGCLFPFMAGLWLLYHGLRFIRGWDLGLVAMLITVGVLFMGASFEFHFRIPLVLLVWCLLFTLTIRMVELNARNSAA